MKKFFVFIAVVVLIFSVSSCKKREAEVETGALAIGSPAPDFTLKDVNGNIVGLSQNRGKVVLIEFWATWCPPCREMTPGLVMIQEKYKDKGFVLLSLVSEDEGEETISSFVKEYGITYRVLLYGRDVSRKYGVTGIPATFLVDKEGKIAFRHTGNTPGIIDELESEIKKLI